VPTLETKCDQEDGGQALELRTEEECQDVVRTVCVERHNVVDNEVCAYSYTLHPVPTEAKLVEPHWNEVCHQETICLNPHHVKPSYGAPANCHEEIHEHCALEPVLAPVVRPVTVSLPQPVEVCINKQVRTLITNTNTNTNSNIYTNTMVCINKQVKITDSE